MKRKREEEQIRNIKYCQRSTFQQPLRYSVSEVSSQSLPFSCLMRQMAAKYQTISAPLSTFSQEEDSSQIHSDMNSQKSLSHIFSLHGTRKETYQCEPLDLTIDAKDDDDINVEDL